MNLKSFIHSSRSWTLRLCLPVALLCLSVASMQAQVNEKPFVTPELTSWQGAEGRVVPNGRVLMKGNAKVLGPVLARFV